MRRHRRPAVAPRRRAVGAVRATAAAAVGCALVLAIGSHAAAGGGPGEFDREGAPRTGPPLVRSCERGQAMLSSQDRLPFRPSGEQHEDSTAKLVALKPADETTEQPAVTAVEVAPTPDSIEPLLITIVVSSSLAVLSAGAWWVLSRKDRRPRVLSTHPVATVAGTIALSLPVTATAPLDLDGPMHDAETRIRALELSREQQRRLVLDAAHELRTPMTSISANIDWLSRAPEVDAATRAEVLASVRQELRELESVMGEIIDLAIDRHEDPPFQRVDLAAIAGEAVERFRRRSQRPVRMRSTHTIVVGDADALRRVVTNLLANADAYSEPGHHITIDVRDGGLWVSDRGDGIPQAERTRVFERHYRCPIHRDQPGSGLGLSIVASTVQAHGGRVDIGDAEGGGARVGFRLPIMTNASSPSERGPALPPPART